VTGEYIADRRRGATVLLHLCLPCAWRNLSKIEAAIFDVLRASQEVYP